MSNTRIQANKIDWSVTCESELQALLTLCFGPNCTLGPMQRDGDTDFRPIVGHAARVVYDL
jgi:hypothetical protein